MYFDRIWLSSEWDILRQARQEDVGVPVDVPVALRAGGCAAGACREYK